LKSKALSYSKSRRFCVQPCDLTWTWSEVISVILFKSYLMPNVEWSSRWKVVICWITLFIKNQQHFTESGYGTVFEKAVRISKSSANSKPTGSGFLWILSNSWRFFNNFKVILWDVIVNHLLSANPAESGFFFLFWKPSVRFFRYNISRWMRPIYTSPLALCPIAFLCPQRAQRVSFFASF